MKVQSKALGILGILLFALGLLAGMALAAGAVWGDLEASLFHSARRGDASLRGLRCPVILTTAETGAIRATLTNPLDRAATFNLRTYISEGFVSLFREERARVPLEPGEKERLEWPVTAEDAAYGRVILARVQVMGQYPLPARQGACGILVFDLPSVTGGQVLAVVLAASLLLLAGGAGLWLAANRPLAGQRLEVARALGALGASVVVALVTSLLGLWVAGLLALVATVLLIGAIGGHFLTRRRAPKA